MAKMKSRFKRKLMDAAKVGGEAIQSGRKVEATARNPVGFALDTFAESAVRWGSRPKRQGAVRGKVQYLNPRTGRWVKVDRKKGKIVRPKKTLGPYKGVRKARRKRR